MFIFRFSNKGEGESTMCYAKWLNVCTRYEKFTIHTIYKKCEQIVIKKYRLCEENKENLKLLILN